MSRSLVGSSSSNTLGSVSSSRSSCSRRRSPPERSPIRVVSRSPVKPKRSSMEEAVISPDAVWVTRLIPSTESSTRCAGSRWSSTWERCSRATVRPRRTRPPSGSSSPATRRSTEVLPAPLTPTRPTRSPGPSRQVACESSRRSPRVRSTSSTSTTSLPSRWVAKRCSSSRSRGSGSSSISALAASIRNFGLEVRAGAPRRSQASSLRMRFCRRDSLAAAWRCRSALASTKAAYPPSYTSTTPSCTSQVVVHTASRNHRSWVTTTRANGRRARWRASQSTASTSRWLVGSSRTTRSCSPSSRRASEQRRRSPPDRPSTSRSSDTPASRTSTTSRVVESAAHSWSARPCSTSSRTVACGTRSSPWVRKPRCSPRLRETRPWSGSSRPATTRSSVVLPSPLRPTTPMRSPAPTPRLTSASSGRTP